MPNGLIHTPFVRLLRHKATSEAYSSAIFRIRCRHKAAWSVEHRPILNLSGEIKVSSRKEVIIHVVVEGLITAHDNIPVARTDMMNGLTVTDQWADDSIQT